ncbi:MAG TPA: aminotransferase class I/II-fold pyridoxal phosphate-dependent enzyme, partial [Candidatus Udaeobacter sp.]|nr:aminotransferase class I/II-fold pyridoxal phosphate-dependent enzyme [Candidatus Udaeobacter sp.]
LAHHHGFLIVSDAAYAEIADEQPCSILEIDGAKEVAIEIGSFSKTFNMTGWRVGWACGQAAAVQALISLKTNLDSGGPAAIQLAAVHGFEILDQHLPGLLQTYAQRRAAALAGFKELGIEVFPPRGAFYVWARVPGEMRSVEFSSRVLDQVGVATTPGVGFGRGGEGWFRIALCSDVAAIQRAMTLLAEAGLWARSAS